MKAIYPILIVCMLFIAGCSLIPGETMVLLDEEVSMIKLAKSKGLGDMNENIDFSIEDQASLDVFENAILTARKQTIDTPPRNPDYDVMVEYAGELPTHAIHLWLGEENEQSYLTYMDGEDIYVTPAKITNQLRDLINSNQ